MSIEDPSGRETPHNSSSELKDLAGREISEGLSLAKDDLDSITQRATADARELGHKAQEKLGEASDKAKSFAADQKDLAAAQINGVAHALSKVADELESSDQQSIGRYARDLAKGLSDIGGQIETRSIDDLYGAAQDFGKNQPVAFLGVAALAGFAASRFALASNQRRSVSSKPGQAGVSEAAQESTLPSSKETGGL